MLRAKEYLKPWRSKRDIGSFFRTTRLKLCEKNIFSYGLFKLQRLFCGILTAQFCEEHFQTNTEYNL